MSKLNYLNLGCGDRFHKDWINVDMVSNSPYVQGCDLLKSLPFANDQFEVIYHSHVLEHFPKEKAPDFIRECYRILKPGGIIRVVVPDLENIVNEYLKHLQENIENPTPVSEANYDWILLEMYDQTVRNYSGGQMADFLKRSELVNEAYVLGRSEYIGRSIRNQVMAQHKSQDIDSPIKISTGLKVRRIIRFLLTQLTQSLSSQEKRIGKFRLSGEIHMWMYDRVSLSRLLRNADFEKTEVKQADESDIPRWNNYELDMKNGKVAYPPSLFMEARKSR